MEKGTIKFFNTEKGFGFIKSESGKDIFVHKSALKQPVKENDAVTYEVEQGQRGLNAVNVRLA